MDELVNDGKYVEAAGLAKSMFDRLRLSQLDDRAIAFFPYLVRASVETGQMAQASTLLKTAESAHTMSSDEYFEPALFREKAALYYATAQYDAAATAAARAFRLSELQNYYSIRAEYCHSIQALALLRMGNVQEAERLGLVATRALPKRTGKHPVFEPRILYAACVVESHAGNLPAAEAFCQRGLQIASSSKVETRDLSLGYLALAEADFQAGDLVHSRAAAQKSADLTQKLFGAQHQDMVDALDILAMISLREGDAVAARARATEAVKIATTVFGAGSPGAAVQARRLHDIEAADHKLLR